MKKIIFAASLAAALIPAASFASDGTITFSGEITARTCVINGGGNNNNFTVNLPKVAASALLTAGSTAGSTPFLIRLTTCTTGSNVRAHFEGGSTVSTTSGRLKNSTGTGRAPNVEVALSGDGGAPFVIGTSVAAEKPAFVAVSAAGAADLSYFAAYHATGAVTAGTVSTSVTYSIEYQ